MITPQGAFGDYISVIITMYDLCNILYKYSKVNQFYTVFCRNLEEMHKRLLL